MGRQLRLGNPPIEVALRRSARAKRLSLRVSRLDGRVTLTIPQYGSEKEAMGFLRERESWLRGHIDSVAPVKEIAIGGQVPIAGHDVPIREGYARLSIRDTRSRWGSCSSQAVLMYSWRLVMAPEDVLNYVAAHECAHLVEMNHSQAFWDVVGGVMPDYAVHRRWLRENGDTLHRVSFDDS